MNEVNAPPGGTLNLPGTSRRSVTVLAPSKTTVTSPGSLMESRGAARETIFSLGPVVSVANVTVSRRVVTVEVTRMSALNSCSPIPRAKRPFHSIGLRAGLERARGHLAHGLLPAANGQGHPRRVVEREIEARPVEPTVPVRREDLRRDLKPARVRSTMTATVAVVIDPERVPGREHDPVTTVGDPRGVPAEL